MCECTSFCVAVLPLSACGRDSSLPARHEDPSVLLPGYGQLLAYVVKDELACAAGSSTAAYHAARYGTNVLRPAYVAAVAMLREAVLLAAPRAHVR